MKRRWRDDGEEALRVGDWLDSMMWVVEMFSRGIFWNHGGAVRVGRYIKTQCLVAAISRPNNRDDKNSSMAIKPIYMHYY